MAEPPNGSLPPPTGDPPSTFYSKRQRRPSVRLGEIGEQPAAAIPMESYLRRCKQYNFPLPTFPRPLDPSSRSHPPLKPRRKRPRSAWPDSAAAPDDPKPHDEDGGDANCSENDEPRWGEDSASPRSGVRVHAHKAEAPDEDPSETGGRGWGKDPGGGVRAWLDGLGLARYAPVFEIHEVDEEALPLLTLEDLREMGVTAVGTRRKMYSAIQKLGKDPS